MLDLPLFAGSPNVNEYFGTLVHYRGIVASTMISDADCDLLIIIDQSAMVHDIF